MLNSYYHNLKNIFKTIKNLSKFKMINHQSNSNLDSRKFQFLRLLHYEPCGLSVHRKSRNRMNLGHYMFSMYSHNLRIKSINVVNYLGILMKIHHRICEVSNHSSENLKFSLKDMYHNPYHLQSHMSNTNSCIQLISWFK